MSGPRTRKRTADEVAFEAAKDQDPTLTEYAEELSAAAPDVFGKPLNVFNIFNVANEQIWDIDPTMRLSTACTFTDTNPECWATEHQRGWNYLLNPRGIELVQLQRGGYFTFAA
ncbi:hypothetical protein MTO96_041693 [Rhipicephalus appendiculatus]